MIAGTANAKLKGADGYAVKAISIPSWFEQLPFYNAAAAKVPRPSEYHAWDMALLQLTADVSCRRCTLAPAVVRAPKALAPYTASFSVAGYAGGAYQLYQSAPCKASLLRDLPVACTKCAADAGQSGGPLLPAATPFDIDPNMPGLPGWATTGLHLGCTQAAQQPTAAQ